MPAGEIRTLIESDRRRERVFVRINYAKLPQFNDFFVSIPTFNSPILTPIIYLVGVVFIHDTITKVIGLNPVLAQFEFVFFFIFIFISIMISIKLVAVVPSSIDKKYSFLEASSLSKKDQVGIFAYMVLGNIAALFVGYFSILAFVI